MDNRLQGKNIVLERMGPTIENAQKIFEVMEMNKEHWGKFLPWVKNVKRVEEVLKLLFDINYEWDNGEKYNYGVFLKNEYIGDVNVFNIFLKDSALEVGYWISKEYAGKGYMKEAIRILEKEVFEERGFNRMYAKCDEENENSWKFIQSCGFQLEGKLREAFYSEQLKSFRNNLVLGKLKSDFDKEKY